MRVYQKPTLESFGTFRDLTRFGMLTYFFRRYRRGSYSSGFNWNWNGSYNTNGPTSS